MGINDSLRANAATRLYNSGVDEQLVMETTGHRVLEVTNEPPASREKLFPTYLPAIKQYHLEIIVK